MLLYTYLKNAVATCRFEPSARGFVANWSYYYDKPLDATQAAAQGNASSGVQLTEADEAAASELRTLPPFDTSTVNEGKRITIVAQERSIYEQYATGYAGAPHPVPLKEFLLLARLVVLDHLGALGLDDQQLEALVSSRRSAIRAARIGNALGAATEPPLAKWLSQLP